MFFITVLLFLLSDNAFCSLWSKGVVHYSVNPKDYDPHSQDVIISTLQKIENEVCVKFFSIPVNYSPEKHEKILHIHNPNKTKTCLPQSYDFTKSVIEMPVGYKCLNERDITKHIVEMLKASIHESQTIINSEDLIQKFQEKDRLENPGKQTLLSPNDRNYINAHYFQECGGLTQLRVPSRRIALDMEDSENTAANKRYYNDKAWPMGIVVYDISTDLRIHPDFTKLLAAMHAIELETCILFQEDTSNDEALSIKHKIVFSTEGDDWPHLGFKEGVQTLKLSSIVNGISPGHTSCALMMLMRILGIPMMSNRYDRDNYVKIHWKNVKKGEEMYLEKTPDEAWIREIQYDFSSATHAPATFLCPGCLTAYTVEPVQDHLWHRTLTMGRTLKLSPGDVETLKMVYSDQCQNRVLPVETQKKVLMATEDQSDPEDPEIMSLGSRPPKDDDEDDSDRDKLWKRTSRFGQLPYKS